MSSKAAKVMVTSELSQAPRPSNEAVPDHVESFTWQRITFCRHDERGDFECRPVHSQHADLQQTSKQTPFRTNRRLLLQECAIVC